MEISSTIMDINTVQSLINNGETETIEYKQSVAELDKLGKSLCGQLNAKGGYGFIGITDSGKIVGTDVTESTKMKLSAFKDYFDPWPSMEIVYIPLPDSDKQIIAIICKSSSKEGPYTFKGKAYLKTPSGIKPMPSEKYKNLLLEHAGLSKAWEEFPAFGFSLADLDHEEIVKTFKIGLREERIPEDEYTENVVEILTHFDLIQGDVINNAAMVLYAKKMPADYSQCFLRMGRFVDDTMDEVIDSKQIRGNAFQLFNEALDFVRRHLPISSRFDPNQFERIDEMALPLLAVREAIINALCHRDYSNRAGDISLYIFNDALEIHNIGHLYGGMTVEQLSVKHTSRRRNERVAQVFHARKLIDRFGGGTRRIFRLCAEQGLPAPVFSEEGDGFQVRFPFKEPIGGSVSTKTTSIGTKIEFSDREMEILHVLINEDNLSLKEIVSRLKTPPAARTVGDDLAHLKSLSIVNSEGMGRGARWFLVNKPPKNGAENGAE